eukprot:3151600-Amphidinium_carterae.1
MRRIPGACSLTSAKDLTQGRGWAICCQLRGQANLCIHGCTACIKKYAFYLDLPMLKKQDPCIAELYMKWPKVT